MPGRSVCLTYPHIGNVGANADDEESPQAVYRRADRARIFCAGFELARQETAQAYLERHGVPVIWDMDTRALVRHLRKVGALRGVIATDGTAAEQLVARGEGAADDGGAGIGGAGDLRRRRTGGRKGLD